MLELYAEGIISVLIVPRDSCWTLPVRAAVVVVMGTQYVYAEAEGSEYQLRDYALTELIRMQSRAVRHSGLGHFYLFCQTESKNTFIHFLTEGLPLESQILDTHDLEVWYRKTGSVLEKQHIVDALSFTFLARRIVNNPTFYDCTSNSRNANLSRIVDKLVDNVEDLRSDAGTTTTG
jgi:antiviral helicase SLH1